MSSVAKDQAAGLRRIHCGFCTPERDLLIPPSWTIDYAMSWFHTEHLPLHTREMLDGLTDVLRDEALCQECRRQLLKTPEHRPCFEPDCACICSRATTTQETP